jgi:S1-C subfamily serine protease
MTRLHFCVALAVLASAAVVVAQPGRPFVPPPAPRPPDIANQMRNQQNQFNAQRQQMDQLKAQVQQQMWQQQQHGQIKMRQEADHLRRMTTTGSYGSGGGLDPFAPPPKKRRIPLPTEVVIAEVGAGGKGDLIGLRVGDVLLSYNDTPITRYWDLGDLHRKLPRNATPATLIVRRGDDTLTFDLKPGALGVWITDR